MRGIPEYQIPVVFWVMQEIVSFTNRMSVFYSTHAVLVPIKCRPCISYIYNIPCCFRSHSYTYIYIHVSSSQHLQQTKASSPYWDYVLLFMYFFQWIILVLVKGDRGYITPRRQYIYVYIYIYVLYLVYKGYILPRWVIIYYLPAFTRTRIIH